MVSREKPKPLVQENTETTTGVATSTPELTLPWLEVVTGKVSELDADEKTVKKELATGDSILAGMILKTDDIGKATIHYPEGSEMRLEKNTILKIEKGNYDTKDESLVVKAELVIGRVWSKIIELATPDSAWEVKTSNAVATVRGTAFGMEADTKKKTKIIGSENKVQISLRNTKTSSTTPTDLMVSKDKVIEIGDDVMAKLLALKKDQEGRISSSTMRWILTERPVMTDDLKDGWIKDSVKLDDVIRDKVKDLNNQGLDKKEIRHQLREEAKKEFQDKINQLRDQNIGNNPPQSGLPDRSGTLTPNDRPVLQPGTLAPTERPIINSTMQPRLGTDSTTEPLPPPDISKAKIEVMARLTSGEIVEGTVVPFMAYAVLPDGKRIDITSRVEWQVGGYIGTVSSDGKFKAEFLTEVSDFEKATGVVIATIKNPSGEIMRGASKILTIIRKLNDGNLDPSSTVGS